MEALWEVKLGQFMLQRCKQAGRPGDVTEVRLVGECAVEVDPKTLDLHRRKARGTVNGEGVCQLQYESF